MYNLCAVRHVQFIDTEETDNPDQKKYLTTGDSLVSGSHDDKKQHRKHKRKSKRKQLEKVAAPPPLRPRSRPTSQQSGTRSEGASSGPGMTELGEGLNATKLNEKQDDEIAKVSTNSKEDTKAGDSTNNSTSEHIIYDNEEIIIVEETMVTSDDKTQATDNSNNINSKPIDYNEETEAKAE